MTYFTRRLFPFLLLIMLFTCSGAFAQQQSEEEIIGGTEFWLSLPQCGRSSDEALRVGHKVPFEMWLSSKLATTVRIESADGSYSKMVTIAPNEVQVVEIPALFENTESEIVRKKGLHLTADNPITVSVFVAYTWTGEAYRVIPVEWLGKKYYTLNMYEDHVKLHDGNIKYTPGEILIVATRDQTNIKYRPAWDTERGVTAGSWGTATLNAGETFLIKGKIDSLRSQSWDTDLSGTYIEGTKPIAVISGHTKAAFPRYTTTMYGLKSDFMRNMEMEMMWPVEMLGTTYISAPIRYNDRNEGYGLLPDDRGDIIRFVATQNGTIIQQMRSDGTNLKQISPVMKAGQVFDILSQLEPGYYQSNYKVLVGQYGKSWWIHAVPPKEGSKDDQLQNPPQNGQGMLITLTPINQWCSYSAFRIDPAMDNFIYLTFYTKDDENITFDGETLRKKFGSSIEQILGTPFSHLEQTVGGEQAHIIESVNDTIKFAAYAYGNWDKYKDGFAYGYPVGVNYAVPCVDSMWIKYTGSCGTYTGSFNIMDLVQANQCASLLSVGIVPGTDTNFTFTLDPNFSSGDKKADFTIDATNKLLPASVQIKAVSRSGKSYTQLFKFIPETISDIQLMNFGLLKVTDPEVCKTFDITNTSDADVQINKVYLKNNVSNFTIKTTDFPAVIPPHGTKTITICAKANEVTTNAISDVVVADMQCYSKDIANLTFTTGEAIVEISDISFGSVPVNTEVYKYMKIESKGQVTAELYSVKWDDTQHFTRIEGLNFPLKLAPGTYQEFKVYYTPLNEADVTHKTVAYFTANTEKNKLYSNWDGIGITAGPTISGFDWKKQRVIDDYALANGTTTYNGTVTVNNVGTVNLKVTSIAVENDLDQVYKLDDNVVKDIIQKGLSPSTPITIPVTFTPKSQKDYNSKVTIYTLFNGVAKNASDNLLGTGIQPHINMKGIDFPMVNLDNTSKVVDKANVVSVNVVPNYDKDLEIYDLTINGANKTNFAIDEANFTMPTKTNPVIVKAGDTLRVPILFTPDKAGNFTATLNSSDNAPLTEVHSVNLTGAAMKTGLITTNYDFADTYIQMKNDNGVVTLINTGSGNLAVTRDLSQSFKAANNIDNKDFYVLEYYLKSNPGVKNMNIPFNIPSNDTLVVKVEFMPNEERYYACDLEYMTMPEGTTNSVTALSHLTGTGMVQRVVVSIPKGYEATPGEIFGENDLANTPIEVKLVNATNEKKPLSQANINEFKVKVQFKYNPNKALFEVFPKLSDPPKASDLMYSNTMLDDNSWEVEDIGFTSDKEMLVMDFKNKNNTPLSAGNGTLFKFKMKAYLSTLNIVPLGIQFSPIGDAAAYTIVDTIPGNVKIKPTCMDSLRLIELSNSLYSLKQNMPNPVKTNTSIQYSIAFDGNVNISLYNSVGDKVADLMNEYKKAGAYELIFKPADLNIPSGVYSYRIESGSFVQTKSMVVTQ